MIHKSTKIGFQIAHSLIYLYHPLPTVVEKLLERNSPPLGTGDRSIRWRWRFRYLSGKLQASTWMLGSIPWSVWMNLSQNKSLHSRSTWVWDHVNNEEQQCRYDTDKGQNGPQQLALKTKQRGTWRRFQANCWQYFSKAVAWVLQTNGMESSLVNVTLYNRITKDWLHQHGSWHISTQQGVE